MTRQHGTHPARRAVRGPGGRPSRRLRGWGGVAAMALACVLTALVTLLPLSRSGADGSIGTGGPGLGVVRPAAADDCTPEDAVRSLKPTKDEGPTVKEIKSRTDKPNKLIVGIDQNSYRWGYRDPSSGKLEGFDITLVRAIADKLLGDPDAVVYRAVPTNQRVEAVESGRVDMVVRTMTINCDRARDVAFSTAYFETGQQLLVPKNSKITGYDSSLKGKRLCLAAGSTAKTELEQESFGADISTTVPNQLDCLVRLQLREVDGVVTDSALAAGQAAQDPTVHLVGKTFTTEYYGVAMNKDSPDLVRQVNQVLDDYRGGEGDKDSDWDKAYEKWLSADLKNVDGPPKPKYRED
ncbi:glutamate ABC transporter substrate-binding protein [Streptomyces boluensis]|uniref:Transporter substrate-binding domain-containing protein n=1 Tax=Streptomyces boluensis TaxID=1775135 RepID=A0A964XLE3_9ACTN|nr:glutamate ABC transporter substrate-binding protein [Streptomyces boluensis]NBE52026.1 transporter substrate-binding domain-containing protein [Streptomyces boluensis]